MRRARCARREGVRPAGFAAVLLLLSGVLACAASTDSTLSPDGGDEPLVTESVEFVWLGVSNWLVRVGDTTLLFDAYYSRPAFAGEPYLDGMPQLRRVLAAAGVHKVDAIFIGHAHFDHISDLGATALLTNAQAVGTPTTCFVAEAQGLAPERCRIVGNGDTLQFGDVTIRVVRNGHWWLPERGPGRHAELTEPPDAEQVMRTPHGGAISFVLTAYGREDLTVFMQNTLAPLSTPDDGSGENYVANLEAAFPGASGARVWLATGNFLAAADDLTEHLRRIRPRWVVPHHWDGGRPIVEDGVAEPLVPQEWYEATLGAAAATAMVPHQYFDRFVLTAGGLRRADSPVQREFGF